MESTSCPPAPTPGARPAAVLIGRRGHRYVLGSVPIGSGAQAEVWPAERDDGHAVAIKLARPGRAALDALDAEGRWLEALALTGHTCAVPCFDHVNWEGRPGLVLPRFPWHVGELVRSRVDAEPGRALEAVLAVAVQLARALEMLHRAELGAGGRLVHRDVKPENVLVDHVGGLRLADLGGSLLADGVSSREVGVFGSPQWAPPDQMLPGIAEPNPTWDTYAACVMLFVWITGERPSFQTDPTPRLTSLGASLHRRLRNLAAAEPTGRTAAIEALFRAREGVGVVDVVAADAPAALPVEDRGRLARGVSALADPARYGDEALEAAVAGLTVVFERGLAPHAWPSPPNRYRDAGELAEALAAIAHGLGAARRTRALRQLPPLPTPREKIHGLGPRAAGDDWPDSMLPERERPRSRAWEPLALLIAFGALAAVGGTVVRDRVTHAIAIADAAEDDDPRDAVVVEGEGTTFRIGRTEVSNEAYRACVAAGACTPVTGVDVLFDGERQPVVGVTWRQATDWCTWAGGRLPTDVEWDRAALQGPSGATRLFPWGEAPLDCTRANVAACGLGLTGAVDGFGEGASAWGAIQLYGNAWEWTSTRGLGGTRVLRGGAFDTKPAELVGGARRRDAPGKVAPNYSFRCVYPG